MPNQTSSSKYIVTSFIWGAISKLFGAVVQFISVPLLLLLYGREDYGLIALAASVNAYLQLLDLGVNTGAIKYFSEWIHKKRYNLTDVVARTSITFYGIIGLINALILTVLAFKGLYLFSLTAEQEYIFQYLLFILALASIFNWATSVFNQLLTADEQLAYVQKVNIVRSIFTLLVVGVTLYWELSIAKYFLLNTIINSLLIIPFYIRSKRCNLIRRFKPALFWKGFSVILKYSLAIMAMAIFQVSAVKLRPLILSIYSTEGIGIVTDFRIIETITLFIISIGGLLISIFLPKTSKLLVDNDRNKIAQFAYNSTKYTSIICVCLCLPFVLCANEILTVYVGSIYLYLSKWLIIWVLTILFFLHNSPIAGLVLSSGKTKMLVYSSAIACIISLVLNAYLCSMLGVGSAVVGYGVYILIQMSFYYFYFNNRILKLQSWLVFKSFIGPTICGLLSLGIVLFLNIEINYLLFQIFVKCCIWLIIFLLFLFLLRIIKFQEISSLIKNK